MLVPMTKVQIIGRKPHVEPVLHRLYRLGLLQLASAREEPALELESFPGESERGERAGELRLLVAQLEGLLALAGSATEAQPLADVGAADADAVARELSALTPLVEPLVDRIEELRTELAVLPRYIQPLRHLLPLVPELAELDESEIEALELDAVALVLNTSDEAVVEALREALRTELGDRFVLVAARVDPDAIGCVIVTPHRAAQGVQALLGRERVRHMPLPARYEDLSFRGAVTAMETRLAEIPAELDLAQQELHALLAPRAGGVGGGPRATPGRDRAGRGGGARGRDEPDVRRRRLDTAGTRARAPRRARAVRGRRARARGAPEPGRGRAACVDAEPEARPPLRVPRALPRPAARRVARPDGADGAVPAADGRA